MQDEVMALRKSEEEKARKNAEREAEAYAVSSFGQAEAAYERGDAFFQIQLPVETADADVLGSLVAALWPARFGDSEPVLTNTQVLAEIELMGWDLHHVGYVYVPTRSSVSAGTTTHEGLSVGIYLFRRAESAVPNDDG